MANNCIGSFEKISKLVKKIYGSFLEKLFLNFEMLLGFAEIFANHLKEVFKPNNPSNTPETEYEENKVNFNSRNYIVNQTPNQGKKSIRPGYNLISGKSPRGISRLKMTK